MVRESVFKFFIPQLCFKLNQAWEIRFNGYFFCAFLYFYVIAYVINLMK